MDFSRLQRFELLGIAASALLLVSIFLPWYSLTDPVQNGHHLRDVQNSWVCGVHNFSCSGWETHSIIRILLILAALASASFLLAHAPAVRADCGGTASGATPCPPTPTPTLAFVSLDVTSGDATTVINVSGGQFLPNQQMNLYWDTSNHVAGFAQADGSGNFNTRVKPFPGDGPGVHKLCASVQPNPCASFSINATPSPTPSPSPSESPSASPSAEAVVTTLPSPTPAVSGNLPLSQESRQPQPKSAIDPGGGTVRLGHRLGEGRNSGIEAGFVFGLGRARDTARARGGGAANALNPGRTRKASRPVGPRHSGQRIPGAQLAGGTARAAGAWRPARARRLVAFAPGRT